MKQAGVLRVLRETGALLDGHFELRSKLHSDRYFQCANVLRYPRKAARLCKALAEQVIAAGIQAETVIAPAMGGILVGHEIARVLNLKSIFAEKENGALVLRRFALKPGEKCIVAEDVVTRGGRVQETIDIVLKHGGIVAAVLTLVDRSDGQAKFNYPSFSLLQIAPVTYEPAQCPMCKRGEPFVHPGS